MKQIDFLLLAVCAFLFLSASAPYGKPWNQHVQSIPGRIECEWYDLGGEGVAYHDSDSSNNGSGRLNPANGEELNEFRMKEGVDISFTKPKGIDDNAYNKVNPELNELYVGWTQPGEWINYTINVHEAGIYRVGTMYTANRDGTIGLRVDGKLVASHLKINSTYHEQDTVAWRQWHHWNKVDTLTEIKMTKGIHVLTLSIEEQGNMNFDYLEWKKR